MMVVMMMSDIAPISINLASLSKKSLFESQGRGVESPPSALPSAEGRGGGLGRGHSCRAGARWNQVQGPVQS